jgi:hypothetical protein
MKKSMTMIAVCLGMFACCATAAEPVLPAGHVPAAAGKKTDWLYKAKWGAMSHFTKTFLAWDAKAGPIDGEKWKKIVLEFDVEQLADQLHECGAGYFLLAARHGGAPPVAPNAVIERTAPGTCPQRDLINDLADALEKRGLHLMLYYSTGMGIDKPHGARQSAAVLQEWSKHYGKKVKGWWLDNNDQDVALQKLLAEACREGNPDALVAFSPPHGVQRNSEYDDYTAGNSHDLGLLKCTARFVNGAQWHALSYLGYTWGGYSKKGPGPRYDPNKAVSLTMRCLRGGGVVTWDIKLTRQGRIADEFMPALKAIGQAAQKVTR